LYGTHARTPNALRRSSDRSAQDRTKAKPDQVADALQLSALVILSLPAPQPALGGSAVGLPTTRPFTEIVRAPEPSGDTLPRHIPLPTSVRAFRVANIQGTKVALTGENDIHRV
jgi:hypothetical protein